MSDAVFIDPAQPVSAGLDYQALRARGIETLQRLAGADWTDFNEHDPGITILEQLCYALTELAYRAELPVEDLLTDAATGRIEPLRQGLHAPADVLTGQPVTIADYRKYLVDREPALANAWVVASVPEGPADAAGLLDIELYAPDVRTPEERSRLVDRVRDAYLAARGLCEDVRSVRVLEAVPAVLAAHVIVDASVDASLVLATVLFRVGQYLAPEIRRQPLGVLLAEGQTPAGVFTGPRLRRGFISDAQLHPRRRRVLIGEVTALVRETPGVVGVQDVRLVTPFGTIETSGARPELVLPDGVVLTLSSGVEAVAGLRVIQAGVVPPLHAELVVREVTRLVSEHRRVFDLDADLPRLLPAPGGEAPDLAPGALVREHFPAVYGINRGGLPLDATDLRRAQARQLQAFLLLFDQWLAGSTARLASGARLAAQPAWVDLSVTNPDLAPLLDPDYRREMPSLESHRHSAEHVWRQREAVLALHGERVEPVRRVSMTALPGSLDGAWIDETLQARAQAQVLRRLPEYGGRRSAGFHYAAPRDIDTVAGVEVRVRLLLGQPTGTPPPLARVLERCGQLELPEAPPLAARQQMAQYAAHIERNFAPITEWPTPPADARGVTLSEELLHGATAPHHYRVGQLPGDEGWSVVCRAPSQPRWQLIDRCATREEAAARASTVLPVARVVARQMRRCYVVEHTLLRFAPAVERRLFEPSFTITVVVCVPIREALDADYRAAVARTVRLQAPAHVAVRTCFVRLSRAVTFERLYWNWREALRGGDANLPDACRELRDFLRGDLP